MVAQLCHAVVGIKHEGMYSARIGGVNDFYYCIYVLETLGLGLSFLLGLSLAAQLGQTLQQMLPQSTGVPSTAGATGQQLNATA